MKNIYLGLKNFERGFMKYGLGGKMLAYPRITFYSATAAGKAAAEVLLPQALLLR